MGFEQPMPVQEQVIPYLLNAEEGDLIALGIAPDIVLPEGLSAIGNHAFSGCSAISGMLEFPSTITSIGNYAFRNCSETPSRG